MTDLLGCNRCNWEENWGRMNDQLVISACPKMHILFDNPSKMKRISSFIFHLDIWSRKFAEMFLTIRITLKITHSDNYN